MSRPEQFRVRTVRYEGGAGTGNVMVATAGSRGIGAATCRRAAETGVRGLRELPGEPRDRRAGRRKVGAKVVAVHADVTVAADVVRLFETVTRG